jgi:hypothetical protein
MATGFTKAKLERLLETAAGRAFTDDEIECIRAELERILRPLRGLDCRGVDETSHYRSE